MWSFCQVITCIFKKKKRTNYENIWYLFFSFSALPKSLSRVLNNPVYLLSLLSSTVFLLVIMGLYAFAAKYLEVVFFVSSLKANIIMCKFLLSSSVLPNLFSQTVTLCSQLVEGGVVEYMDYVSAEEIRSLPTSNECPEYHTKLHLMVTLVLELWAMRSTSSLPLLPGPFWPRVVVLVRVSSMGQIEQFNHLLYLKPFGIK